ncbi:MAG: hypothetical protein ABIW76_22930 [Fibrobacteria bacterium]
MAQPVDESSLEAGTFKYPGSSDSRAVDRISERELGILTVAVRLGDSEVWHPVRLWDFNGLGFGVVTVAKSSGPGFSEGEEVEVRIVKGSSRPYQLWCQVKNVGVWRDGVKVGLRRLDVNLPQLMAVERRGAKRLALGAGLSLKARLRHPFLFGRWCPVTVYDINRSLGLSFRSEDASLLLFEGMELEIHFELPSLRSSPMHARVAWVHATREHEIRFGGDCQAMDFGLHDALCNFLMVSRQWTPEQLREVGFKAGRIKACLRYRTVKTMEDYAAVLHLRRDAYVEAGKKPADTPPEKMAALLDGVSRILTAHHQDALVGSITFTFPVSEETVLDSQAGFPGCRYPVRLPPKTNLIEVSRLCVHPGYHGTDLLIGLFEHGLKHFLLSDRHWLLTSATEDLMPLYRRIGFTRLKASYKHPQMQNQEHHLIIAHRSAFLWGFGIGILTWNSVFGNLVAYLLDRNLIPIPGWMRAIIRVKLAFRSLAALLTDSRARAGFRRHMSALLSSRRFGRTDPLGR